MRGEASGVESGSGGGGPVTIPPFTARRELAAIIDGAEAYRAFKSPFVQILTPGELIVASGDEEKVPLVHGTRTTSVS